MSNDDDEDVSIVWGQDLVHCKEHCYEAQGIPKWRCLAPKHVSHKNCSEDFLHCKVCYKIIDNQDGTHNYCKDHTP